MKEIGDHGAHTRTPKSWSRETWPRKRTHDAAEIVAAIVAKHLVEPLEQGFVVVKKPPIRSEADCRSVAGLRDDDFALVSRNERNRTFHRPLFG